MATKVTERDEIELNGYKYKIKGGVTGGWLDPFPEAFTLGDADYANRRDLSSWIINDLRGGIGVEEMDEKVDWNKCWWTDCIIKYRNHILPPRLAMALTSPTITAPTITNGDMELNANWTGGAQSTTVEHGGSWSWMVERTTAPGSTAAYQNMSTYYPGGSFTISGWLYFVSGAGEGHCHLTISDGVSSTESDPVSASAWTYVSVSRDIDINATYCRVNLLTTATAEGGGGNLQGYFDDVTIDSYPVGIPLRFFANHNEETYGVFGSSLAKLNEARTVFDNVLCMPGTPTALISSLQNGLYIYLGDTDKYWVMKDNTVEDCEDAWDELIDADVISTVDTTDKKSGSGSVKLVVAAGCAAGDILATEDISIDMTTYKTITLWAKSSVACAAADIKLLLDESAVCADPDKTLSLPALVANTWKKISLDLGDTSALNAVISIGVEMDVDKGAFTLHLDKIEGQSFAESDSADAYWGFQHDAKLFKVNTSGTVKYSTDPADAAPTWASAGTITDIADQIEGFVVGRDASGAYVPYAATHSIIKVYDSATPQWIDSEARLPNHPIGGKGSAYWNGKLYFSYGLAVKEYYPESGAFIDIGLTERDGLPLEYNGEIVKLLGDTGVKGMFALVDSNQVTPNLLSNGNFENGDPPEGWTLAGASATVSRSSTQAKIGAYSALLTRSGTDCDIYQDVSDYASYLEKKVTLGCWIYATVASRARLRVIDGTDDTYSSYHSGVAGWEWLSVTHTVNASADKLRSVLYVQTGDTAAYFDGATLAEDSAKSGIYLYDSYGWQCWWVETSNNGTMHDIIVSSASSGYAVYWDCGGIVYYIDIPRGIENPDKISQSYATSGILITPWFDAGNPVAAKLAKVLEDYAKGITTTETVALYYRIDHTQTALDLDHSLTYWTLLETLNTTGETGHNEELFASGAGVSFKAIQFRLDFVTPGATAKPDIQSLVLYFKKRTGSEKLRVWNVTIICDNLYNTSAKEKTANLKSAIESTVDVLFSYHPNDASTESYYVTVDCPSFNEQTGREYESNYNLKLTES